MIMRWQGEAVSVASEAPELLRRCVGPRRRAERLRRGHGAAAGAVVREREATFDLPRHEQWPRRPVDRDRPVGEGLEQPAQRVRRLGGKTSMQWVTIITYCLEDEAASGKAEAAVANREPVSQRRRRRGALPNANATSVTQRRACRTAASARRRRPRPAASRRPAPT